MSIKNMLGSTLFWWTLGCSTALLWWYYVSSLPAAFNGENFGDPEVYISTAKSFESLWHALKSTDMRAGGYTLFLFLHSYFFTSWTGVSTVTTLVLHLFASTFLFFSIRTQYKQLHPASLFLVLIHPAIIGMTAIHYADVFVTSLTSILFGMILLLKKDPIDKQWLLLLCVGFVAGVIISTKTSHYLPVSILVTVLCLQLLLRQKPTQVILGVSTILFGMFLFLGPRLVNCTVQSGALCLMPPETFSEHALKNMKDGLVPHRLFKFRHAEKKPNGRVRNRTTTTFIETSKRTTLDCDSIAADNSLEFITRCYSKNITQVPTHMLHKFVAFFDEPWITYLGALVTPDWVLHYKRLFGALSFAGFFALVLILIRSRWRDVGVLLPLYIVSYVVMHVLFFPVISRYGLPLYPLSLFALFIVLHHIIITKKQFVTPIITITILTATFYATVHTWDKHDELMNPCLEERLQTKEVYPDFVDTTDCM